MQERTLGRTDVRLTEIALGTWGLASGAYGEVTPSDFEVVVRQAWDHGVRTFDVAPLWGDGESERRVAAALGAEKMEEATIVGRAGQRHAKGTIVSSFEPQAILEDVEGSLERLGREHLDVLMLHDPPMEVLRGEPFRKAVDHLVATGKVRAWGVGVGGTDEARLALKLGASALGIVHHLLAPQQLQDLASSIKDFGCGILVRSPLSYGLLAGRWTKETTFPKGDHRSRRWSKEAFAQRIEHVESLRFLVRGDVPDLASAALRFVLASPFVTSAAVGARTGDQIASAAAASVEPPYLPAEDVVRATKMGL
jgi:aryl-alcohol dehydrogenase-like predicted oxidoreductase